MQETRSAQQLTRKAMAVVLAGGDGSGLNHLTDHRAKAALYFGAKYRLIDFTLSNCLNSGVRRIGVVTQSRSHSLQRHLQHGWSFLRAQINEFIDLLPAQPPENGSTPCCGTAEAVYRNVDILRSHQPEYLLVLAGDHVYKMDYSQALARHVASGAECTVLGAQTPLEQAAAQGIMAVDRDNRVSQWLEQPTQPPAMPDHPDHALARIGAYIFNADFLYAALERDHNHPASGHDFDRDIVAQVAAAGRAAMQPFSECCVGTSAGEAPYWCDPATVDDYWAANLDLTNITPALDLYDSDWPVLTYQRQLPSAKFVLNESVTHSLISGGCLVTGSTLRSSLLFSQCVVAANSVVEESLLLPGVQVGRGVRLRRVVVERGCCIPDGLVAGEDPADDARRFHYTPGGITLITRPMLAALSDT